MKLNITTATNQGEQDYQEDRLLTEQNNCGALLAVADGHGDDADTASLVCQELPKIWSTRKTGSETRQNISTLFRKLNQLTSANTSGTTLSMAWVSLESKTLYTGILGDSLVAVNNPEQELWVGPEHNARSNPEERDAAIKRGAVFDGRYLYYRGRGLQISRSLGDSALAPILNRSPEIFVVPIVRGSVILIASDGIFSSWRDHYDTAHRFAWVLDIIHHDGDAQAIVNDAVQHGAMDNVTVVLCRVE
jgi:serine/threonine protein phosphatase PrpC